jgi:hypothetical protein
MEWKFNGDGVRDINNDGHQKTTGEGRIEGMEIRRGWDQVIKRPLERGGLREINEGARFGQSNY